MNTKKLLNSAGAMLALLSVVWFVRQFFVHSISLPPLSGMTIPYIGLIILIYSVPSVISGSAWFILLQSVGEQRLQVLRVVSISCLSQVGKYVPGNVAHHVGRVVLAKRHGLGVSNTLFTMFMETVWVIAIAALLALVAITVIGRSVLVEVPYLPQWWVFGWTVAIAMLLPLLSHRIFKRIAKWWASRKGIEVQSVQMPALGTFWLVGLLYIINYIILGLVLQLIAEQIFADSGGNILLLSGIFAVAWIVGFITPGAPAGLGIREVVLVAALTPVYGNETSIGIAAVLRVVTLLGDGVSFLIGLGIAKGLDKKIAV